MVLTSVGFVTVHRHVSLVVVQQVLLSVLAASTEKRNVLTGKIFLLKEYSLLFSPKPNSVCMN